jgi:hypothetical protein
MVLTGMHGLAISAIAVTQLAMAIKLLLLIPLALSLVYGLRVHALRSSVHAVSALILRTGSEIELIYRDNARRMTKVEPSSTVLHELIVLHLRAEKKHLSLLLLPDMLDAESWRKLSVLLRALKTH